MKRDWPQKKYLKPPFGQRDPKEEYEARRKGAYAAHAARRRNAEIRNAVNIAATLNIHGTGAAVDIESLKSLDDLNRKKAPLLALLVQTQFEKAIKGDKEARDWICRMLGAYDTPKDSAQGENDNPPAGLKISIIRKARDP